MRTVESNMRREGSESGIQNVFNIGDKFMGFSGHLDEEEVRHLQSQEAATVSIRPVRYVTLSAVQANPPSWGLARVGSRESGKFDESSYTYPDSAGRGVTVYVLDSGCNPDHEEFKGRATLGKAFDGSSASVDHNGHGTHVAGTIAGTNYGVAKKAQIVCVKVIGDAGYGAEDNVIAGISWVVNDAKPKRAVANVSLGTLKSEELDNAVAAAVEGGLTFAVAAGNSADDACSLSPGRSSVKGVLTVGVHEQPQRALAVHQPRQVR
jgi:subtilisin family serine protease